MRRKRSSTGSLLLGLLAAAIVRAGPASASTSTVIEVYPGPSAIENALQQANQGDTLNIHAGAYQETVLVSVPKVTLQPAGDGTVTVDGGCLGTTIAVEVNGVSITGLHVTNGNFYDVNFVRVSGGRVSENVLTSTCPLVEYGINLFATGRMLIEGNSATGFGDAGIYIGGITDTGHGSLITRDNTLFGNERGIIVEDSSGVSLIVRANYTHDNFDDGIFLHNSDGIVIRSNTASDNAFAGIELDSNSDQNLVSWNRSRGQPYDLVNGGGVGNCFMNNVYTTSFGTISC